ncbi:MAG: fumarylacetoacetate hydrolase family protein, partial [Salinibacter sp.]
MKIALPNRSTPVHVGKLLCIGRNYADHAAEMDREVPDEPMVFLKPPSALVRTGGTVQL